MDPLKTLPTGLAAQASSLLGLTRLSNQFLTPEQGLEDPFLRQ